MFIQINDEQSKQRVRENVENALKDDFDTFYTIEMSNWHSSIGVLHSLNNKGKIRIINEESF